MDIIYPYVYLFEINYSFSEKHSLLIDNFLSQLNSVNRGFDLFCNKIDYKEYPNIINFQMDFINWRQEIELVPESIIEIEWGNQNEKIENNYLYLNMAYKDRYLLQVLYNYNFQIQKLTLTTEETE